ncbi:MAG: hypothetical protein V4697_01910 [Patescibacteria group bacterium]
MAKKTQDEGGAMKVALVGATLAGIAAGAYFLFGPNGKKHQKQAKSWAIKMKGEVIEKLEKAKDVSEANYHEIIDKVTTKYATGKYAAEEEVQELAADLKKHWKTLSGGGKKKTAKK